MRHRQSRWSMTPAWLLVIVAPSWTPSAARAAGAEGGEALAPRPPVIVGLAGGQLSTPPPPFGHGFSTPPTEDEIVRTRVFDERFVAIGGPPADAENIDLAAAISIYVDEGDPENAAFVMEDFLRRHPKSAWSGSVLAGVGGVYRRTGSLSKAVEVWRAAWLVSKDATEPRARAIADRAVSELVALNACVGRKEALEEVLDEVEGRPLVGAAALKVVRARQAHWLMVHRPDEAYQGGAVAIDRILMAFHGGRRLDYRIPEARSSLTGMSLAQIDELAEAVGLEMQVAKRDRGAEVLSPAVLHRKGSQFWALLREEGGRYLVQDPTFAGDLWVSREVLEHEASGYFLVPAGSLPSGWTPLGRGECQDVWGTGMAVCGVDLPQAPQF